MIGFIIGWILSGILATIIFWHIYKNECGCFDSSSIFMGIFIMLFGYFGLCAIILIEIGEIIYNFFKKKPFMKKFIEFLNKAYKIDKK